MLLLLADFDLGGLVWAQISLFRLVYACDIFMQAVGFSIIPSMKQHLAENCVCTANYNISGKKHFCIHFQCTHLSHRLHFILYAYQHWQ